MARNNDIARFVAIAPSTTEGTVTAYVANGERAVLFTGWDWFYESAEDDTDNTVDFAIAYTTDGSTFVDLFVNADPIGLLDTCDPLVGQVDTGDPATSGGAAIAVTPTEARIPPHAVIRIEIVTAGSGGEGNIPAIQVAASGRYV